jgi:hypothetical protein
LLLDEAEEGQEMPGLLLLLLVVYTDRLRLKLGIVKREAGLWDIHD